MDAILGTSHIHRIVSCLAGQCFTPEDKRSLYKGGGKPADILNFCSIIL